MKKLLQELINEEGNFKFLQSMNNTLKKVMYGLIIMGIFFGTDFIIIGIIIGVVSYITFNYNIELSEIFVKKETDNTEKESK